MITKKHHSEAEIVLVVSKDKKFIIIRFPTLLNSLHETHAFDHSYV